MHHLILSRSFPLITFGKVQTRFSNAATVPTMRQRPPDQISELENHAAFQVSNHSNPGFPFNVLTGVLRVLNRSGEIAPVDHSPEDAVQAVDSITHRRRVFFTFGGPPRAMGHSLTVAAL